MHNMLGRGIGCPLLQTSSRWQAVVVATLRHVHTAETGVHALQA